MKSRRPKQNTRRSMSEKLFGSTSQGFGTKKVKFWRNELSVLLVIVLLGGGLIYWSSLKKEHASGETASAAALFQSEAFDPVKDYVTVRDSGTLTQLSSLLSTLGAGDLRNEHVPVQLEKERQIIEIADAILNHPDCDVSSRSFALKSSLDSNWRRYKISQKNGLNDPFVAEKFFAGVENLLEHEDFLISRQANLLKAKGIVLQTSMKQFEGSFKAVENSIGNLLKKYPSDPVVIENVKKMFTQYRAYDGEAAARLATALTPLAEMAGTTESNNLSRFMKDIIALYDSGIGNPKVIQSILVDDQEFMQRLLKLNETRDSGEVVMTQLDNAIEFFEREGKFDLAAQLASQIIAKADDRTNPESMAMAKLIGDNALQRNAIIGKKWSFDGLDSSGETILPSRYSNRVVLVAFYSIGNYQSPALFASLSNLNRHFLGKSVDFILVGVEQNNADNNLQTTVPEQFISLTTNEKSPGPYLSQCPTKRFPYAILIDKQGNVDSINITLSTVVTRIEYLLSRN